MALEDRVRERIAADSDDFFDDSDLVEYLNKGQNQLAGFVLSREQADGTTYRVLDQLRTKQQDTPSGFSSIGNYHVGTVNAPSDMLSQRYLVYNNETPLKEYTYPPIHLLHNGNLRPSQNESYYYVTEDTGNVAFQLYLFESPDGSTDTLDTYYHKTPTKATTGDNSFSDYPVYAENAIITYAAWLATIQENAGEKTTSSQNLRQQYQDELQTILF